MVSSQKFKDFVANEYGIMNYPATRAEFTKAIDEGFGLMRDMIQTYDIKN